MIKKVKVIDSHTGGEPTRLVIDGFPNLTQHTTQSNNMKALCDVFKNQFDAWRKRIILEPRGNDILVGALLTPAVSPQSSYGVIFFNNSGYLGMCGHGTIGVIASLAYLGEITVGKHILDTTVGSVTAELHQDNSVSIENVAAYRYRKNISVHLPEYGNVTGDIAWGGNWFFLISQHTLNIDISNTKKLLSFTIAVKDALVKNHIYGKNNEIIDHIELFSSSDKANSKNFVLCPGEQYDRSPCGTGTSAKIACLAADNQLVEKQIWRQNSILDTQFEASYQYNQKGEIIPNIRGNAYVCAESTLIIDEKDPLINGIEK